MRLSSIVTAALLAVGSSGCLFAQNEPQSLAEVAKHQTAKKPVIELTDDNFSRSKIEDKAATSVTSNSVPVTSTSSVVPTPAQDKSTAASKKLAASPAEVKDVKHLEEELAGYRQQEETWNNSAADYEQKLSKEPSEFRRNTYREALENDQQNVDFFRQKIRQTEDQLDQAKESDAKKEAAAGAAEPGK